MEETEGRRKAPKLKYHSGEAVRALRKKRKLNQVDFWRRIGVTQSGGSRYENGRGMPAVVALAVELVWGTDREAEKLLEALRVPDALQVV